MPRTIRSKLATSLWNFRRESSGESSFKWTDVDVDWEDGQTIPVSIVQTSAPEAPEEQGEPAANKPATGAPTISGAAQVDETLTAETPSIADEDGLEDVSYRYQWTRSNGSTYTDIDGETDSAYTLVLADQGKTIKVRVTFTDDADNKETLTSEATVEVAAAPNREAAGAPTIGGTAQVGNELTAQTSDVADADGLTNPGFRYQWLRNDGNEDAEIGGATGSSYVPVEGDVGKTIKVRVTFSDDKSNEETLTSAATVAVAAALPSAPLHVRVSSHDANSLDVSWEAPSSDGGSAVAGYKVQRKEATGSWDTPADVSEETVTGNTHTITGLTEGVAYAVARNRHQRCWRRSSLRLRPRGRPRERPPSAERRRWGQTLTADTTGIYDDDGLANVSYSYQWIRSDNGTDTDIAGETDSTYTLVAADMGKTLKVRVSFTDDAEKRRIADQWGDFSGYTAAAAASGNRRYIHPRRQAAGLRWGVCS